MNAEYEKFEWQFSFTRRNFSIGLPRNVWAKLWIMSPCLISKLLKNLIEFQQAFIRLSLIQEQKYLATLLMLMHQYFVVVCCFVLLFLLHQSKPSSATDSCIRCIKWYSTFHWKFFHINWKTVFKSLDSCMACYEQCSAWMSEQRFH